MIPIYSTLTEKENVLIFNESNEIYKEVINLIDYSNTEEMEYWKDFILSCIDYSEIRSTWSLISREEKLNKDLVRTAKQNTMIRNLKIIKRIFEHRNENIDWYNHFNDDRKRIGDFAYYINYIYSLSSR